MHRKHIDAATINQLFHGQVRKRSRFPSWQFLTASFCVIIGMFFLLNAPAFNQQLRYWWETDISTSRSFQQQTTNQGLPVVKQLPAAPELAVQTPGALMQVKSTEELLAAMPANTIWIPKIKVTAPIIWDVTSKGDLTTDLLEALQGGVVRYPQTALPNQIGNVFLTGHSSNYWWEKGRYKTIFALLDRLVVGDVVHVKYEGIVYTYRVSRQQVVKPTQTSVLDSTAKPTLSLMTCTPVGTNLLRRVVTAELISPTDLTKKQPVAPANATLQAIR